jgi:hypothetical protein
MKCPNLFFNIIIDYIIYSRVIGSSDLNYDFIGGYKN